MTWPTRSVFGVTVKLGVVVGVEVFVGMLVGVLVGVVVGVGGRQTQICTSARDRGRNPTSLSCTFTYRAVAFTGKVVRVPAMPGK